MDAFWKDARFALAHLSHHNHIGLQLECGLVGVNEAQRV